MTKRKFLYNLSRASYQKSWGKNYQPPTFCERFLAFLVRILPKIGPLKSAATPDAYARGGTHVRSQLQRNSGIATGSC